MKTKIKNNLDSIVGVLREDLREVDCLMDDYFDAEANECGMKWFSFNEEKLRRVDELVRISVWSLDANCFDVEEMMSSKYVWLGDLVARIDSRGNLVYVNDENSSGLIAEDLVELFKGFCAGKVVCGMPNQVEVRVRM